MAEKKMMNVMSKEKNKDSKMIGADGDIDERIFER